MTAVWIIRNQKEKKHEISDNWSRWIGGCIGAYMAQAGNPSEVDGLVFEVVRMGKQYGVELPVYQKIKDKLSKNM